VEERAARIRRYLPYLAGVFGEWPPTNVTVALLPPREGADRACFGATEGGLVLADSRPGCDEEAHELVHLWLMGPVRPASPGELWFIEGASEYYGLKARLAAGELDEEGFLAAVRHPAEDAALAGFRLDDAGARSAYDPVAREALYARGAAAVHELDLAIAAGDASGLDPLMARLYRGFGRSQRPLTNDDIASEASALAGSDLGPLVRALVNGTGAVSPSVAPPSGPACEAEEACLGELERLRRRERALWAVAALMAVLAVLRRRASAPA
jgi:hypothetical protein